MLHHGVVKGYNRLRMDINTWMPLLIVLVLVLIVWCALISLLVLKQKQFFAQFTKGITKKDLKSSLVQVSKRLDQNDKNLKNLQKQIDAIVKQNIAHFQKHGFIRFNPYSDTGGNQSFCLCLLDDKNDGIVITSLHSREQTRIYAKSISKGKVEGGELSKEEQQALKEAMKK